MENDATLTPSATSTLPLWVGAPLLALGPELTARVLLAYRTHAVFATPGSLPIALFVLVGLVWNPFAFSVPAAVLQFARRGALGPASPYSFTGMYRALTLVPRLLVSPTSRVRLESWAALLGWVYGVLLTIPHLHGVAGLHG